MAGMLRIDTVYLGIIALSLLWLQPACAAHRNLPLHLIRLPEGFRIEVLADRVPKARAMAMGANGTLFVGSSTAGRVYALPDADRRGPARRVITLLEGLTLPTGVAFQDGALYVAETDRIIRLDEIESKLDQPPEPHLITGALPSKQWHGRRQIGFGPDRHLYIAVGAPCNVCDMPGTGVISRLDPVSAKPTIIARGIRNSVGFDWHPDTGELWFTDNGRDHLGDDLPADELNHAGRDGLDFGFPYCHGGDLPDPQFGRARHCREFAAPAVKLGAHVAPLGMTFYTGKRFPAAFRNQIFIAEHGSWNRSSKVGYRITLVRLSDERVVSYEPFAEGWLQGERAWGRPVDVLVTPGGDLLVSDDYAGAIYRIYYGP